MCTCKYVYIHELPVPISVITIMRYRAYSTLAKLEIKIQLYGYLETKHCYTFSYTKCMLKPRQILHTTAERGIAEELKIHRLSIILKGIIELDNHEIYRETLVL